MITVITVGGRSVNLVSMPIQSYTDLALGSAGNLLSSAAHPFTSGQVGFALGINGGGGFNAGEYTILSVASGVATLNVNAGAPGSTGGTGGYGGTAFPREVEFTMEDAVATVTSVFTGQVQAQQWPGADMWRGTITQPPMNQANTDNLIAYLMELRGMANALQIGDPMKTQPRGTGSISGTNSATAAAGSQTLTITGAGAGALLAGDYIQIGYRLHRVLGSTGSGAVGIWPSLREALVGGEPQTAFNTVGLFRLASNQRKWSSDYTRMSRISFQIQEYR